MTIINLKDIRSLDSTCFDWLMKNFGPASQGRWKLIHLNYIEFTNDKDAVLFALRWI